MSVNPRIKGSASERELLKILNDELGVDLARNLTQTRGGGADADKLLAGFSIEIKRRETLSLNSWWLQAVKQAKDANAEPCLVYRQSRQPWRFVIPLHDISVNLHSSYVLEYTATLLKDGFCALIREKMNG